MIFLVKKTLQFSDVFFHVFFTRIIYNKQLKRHAHFFNNVMRENTTLACDYSCYLNLPCTIQCLSLQIAGIILEN